MAGVDNRIVTMKFDNREFEQNARTSMSTLQKLKESMDFGKIVGTTVRGLGTISSALGKLGLHTPFAPLVSGANKAVDGIGRVFERLGMKNPFGSATQSASDLQRAAQAAGGPAGMGVLEGGVTAVSNKFLLLSTIAITALSNITNKAINAGTSFLKSFTFGPIMQGMEEYELNLKSIQTIQANTDQPLTKINNSLDELNKYSDQTIYNFAEMAKNVGTFTAAGVDLETSVSSIKGIANLAAMSGSSSQQAATAMYQLSQAIAAGRVGLMDWNSVVNAGMGGKKLQNALAQTAVAMGQLEKGAVKMVGPMKKLEINGNSFRESIMAQPGQETWLSSEALVTTLATMDGRFSRAALSQEKLKDGTLKYNSAAEITNAIDKSRAELAKQGVHYTKEQFEELKRMSTQAFKSATEVKTFGEVWSTVRETIGSGWQASFRNIFGNLNQAKKLFTGMKDALTGIIDQNALARNEMLKKWAKDGGRFAMIEGFKNAWQAVLKILGPIKDGFRDIFPAQTAKSLISMSEQFQAFTKKLIPSKDTMANIRDIAGGLFAVLGIGKTIVMGAVDGFQALFGAIGGGEGNFLGFLANIGNLIKRFNEFLAESGIVTAFFTGLGKILAIPLALLAGIGGIFSGMFSGFDKGAADKVGGAIDGVGEKLSGLQAVGDRVRGFFEKIGEFFGNIGEHIGNALVGIGDVIAGAFTADTFESTLDVINTTLLGGLVLMIKRFFSSGVKIDLTGGLFDGIKKTLGEATSAFETMQTNLKADILMKLAAAIAVMAAALFVLSTIDPGAMTKALGAMTAGFGILIGALMALMNFLGAAGLVQMYVVTSAMTKMALSILLMAFALKTLAGINFGDMLRGLVGLAAVMYILTKAMVPLAAGSKGMGRAAWSLIAVGIAINILAVALKLMASMSWEELLRGLAGLTGTLAALAAGLKLMPPLQAEALGLMALGVAINLLAVALKIFATMSWEDMAKGTIMLAVSLNVIASALKRMPKTMMLQAAALVAVAGAMVILSGALKIMGSMGWESIAKGLIVMGGALGILVIGLNAMRLTGVAGAAALVVAAGALAILVPVIAALGALSWESIIKALVGLSGVFVVIGVAGYLLAPLIPVILALAGAFLIFGAGLALAGAGALAAATAFGIVVGAGMAGAQVLAGLIKTIIDAIPPAMVAFAKGIVQFAVAIGQGAPAIATAFGRVLSNLIDQVIKLTPKLAKMFLVMLTAALKVIVTAAPKIANAGMKLIVAFLEAIDRRIGKIVDLAVSIITKWIDGIARNLDKIIKSGVNLILKFMEGIAKAIRNNSEEFGRRGADIGIAIVEGAVRGIAGAGGQIRDKLMEMARDAWGAVKNFFGVDSPSKLMRDTIGKWLPIGMAAGIDAEGKAPSKSLEKVGNTALDTLQTTMSRMEDAFVMSSDVNPTITPVLDLTALTREANKMSDILAVAPIAAGVSYQTASSIAAMTQASAEAAASDASEADKRGDTYVTLEQHNHSPKALDAISIYRDGKSLLSLAKETLK